MGTGKRAEFPPATVLRADPLRGRPIELGATCHGHFAQEREATDNVIKCIVFDIGGVLVPEKGYVIDRQIAERLGIDEATFAATIRELKFKATAGQISLRELYAKALAELGKTARAEDLLQMHIALYRKMSKERDAELIDLVEELKARFLVACLTNTEPEIGEINRKEGLFAHFHKAYLSTDMGLRKPQPEIYRAVLDDLGFKPEETIFVDDNTEYVRAAQQLGMAGILYRGPGELRKALETVLANGGDKLHS